MLAFYLAAPEVENDRRALNTFVGMRRARKEGRWLTMAPKGYRNCRSEDNKPIIEISKDAPLVREAFQELAKGVLDIEAVRKKMAKKGLKISRSAFWCMVRSPMYCGKIFVPAWKDEEARYVKGLHEPLISERLFDEVQDILNGRKRNIKARNTRHEFLPLRGYLVCRQCGRPLTGSGSKGKGGMYYYYHCQTSLGCKERFKADIANEHFLNYVKTFKTKSEVLDLYLMIMEAKFKNGKANKVAQDRELDIQIARLNTRLKNAREMMLDGEMERSEYKSIVSELEPELEKLKRQKTSGSNLGDEYQRYLKQGFCLLKGIDKRYQEADVEKRQQIIGVIFPEKLVYDGGTYRTNTPHPLFQAISATEADSGGNKKREGQHFADLSCQVAHP